MKKIISLSLGGLFLLGATSMAQDVIAPASNSGATAYASPPTQATTIVGGQGTVQPGGAVVSGPTIVGGDPSTWGPPLNQGQTIYGGDPSTWGPPWNQVGPYYPQPGYTQPIYPQNYPINMNGFQPQVYYPPYNPAVIQTPNQLQSVQYDQWGRVILNTGSQTVYNSAFNAGRNQVMPGTLVNVSRYELDQFGNSVHVTGQEWTGLDGQPHANLNRNTVTSNNGVIINNDNVQVYRSQATPPTPTPDAGGN